MRRNRNPLTPFALLVAGLLGLGLEAAEPVLVWQRPLPLQIADDGTSVFAATRQSDGSILVVTWGASGLSPRIVSPQGGIASRSQVRYPADWALGDPWGGFATDLNDRVWKFDARTGQLLWSTDRGTRLAAVLDSGHVLVGTDTGGALLDSSTGAARWSTPGTGYVAWTASIAVGLTGSGAARKLVGVDVLTGTERWRLPAPAPTFTNEAFQAGEEGALIVAESSMGGTVGIAVRAIDLLTGTPLWGPLTLPKGTLPTSPWWVRLSSGADGSVAVGAMFGVPSGSLLADFGVWKIRPGGTLAWGPQVFASPVGSQSNDGLRDLVVTAAGDVLVAGLRGGSTSYLRGTSVGFLTRLAAADGHRLWDVPRSGERAAALTYDQILPDGDAIDVLARVGTYEAGVRLFRFSLHDGSQLRPAVAVDGRTDDWPSKAVLSGDAERVKVAGIGAGGSLHRLDLSMATGEILSASPGSRQTFHYASLSSVTAQGQTLVGGSGSGATPEAFFMETAQTVRWKRSGPNGAAMGLTEAGAQVVGAYAAGSSIGLLGLSRETGEVLWGPLLFTTSDSTIRALPGGDVLYVLSAGPARRLLRINSATGAIVWDRMTGAGSVPYVSDLDIAADASGISLAWSTATGKALERRRMSDGEVVYGPLSFPGSGDSQIATNGTVTFLAILPADVPPVATLRGVDSAGTVLFTRAQPIGGGARADSVGLVASPDRISFAYDVPYAPATPEFVGLFVATFRATDGEAAAAPIRVGSAPTGTLTLVPGAGVLLYSGGALSRIDDVLRFGPLDGVLPAVSCGSPVDLDLGLRNAAGPVTFSFVSPGPPGLSLTGAGRLVGIPLTDGVFSFRVRAEDASGSFEATLTLAVGSQTGTLAVSRSPAGAVCPGSSVTLTAPAGYSSYEWLPSGLTGASITVSPEHTATHYVVARGADGCAARGSVLVPVVSVAGPVLSGPRSASAGDVVDVLVEGGDGGAFLWEIENGEILAGQGTYQVRIRTGGAGVTHVRATPVGAVCTPPGEFRVEVRRPAGLYTVVPCRLVDTRLPDGLNGGPALAMFFPTVMKWNGHCGIPETAVAVVVNVTLIPAAPLTTAYICVEDGPCLPNLEARPGTTRTTAAIVKLPRDGSGRVVALAGGTASIDDAHLVVDVSGYFE